MHIQSCRLFLSRLPNQVTPTRLAGNVSIRQSRFLSISTKTNTSIKTLDITSKLRPWCASTLGYRYLSTSPLLRESVSAPQSTITIVETIDIPEPPKVPTFSIDEVITTVQSTGEQPLTELGLGGMWPSGMVQSALEWLHVDIGLPWWQAIAVATVILRILMFPLVVKAQKNAAKMANNLPQLQLLQNKMTQARMSGNAIETMRYTHELQVFMKEKEINPFKSMLVPLAQAPIFMSMFFGLRGMANLPVESMKYGGIFWFVDLTVPDAYYLLPALTCATMFLTIKLGTEMGNVPGQASPLMMKVITFFPVPTFFFILNFPSAMLCYWTTTNLVSLIQAGILRMPAIRDYFGIDRLARPAQQAVVMQNKGFMEQAKEAWQNMKITDQLKAREQHARQLKNNSLGAVPKTYKYDPTQQSKPVTAQKIVKRGLKAIESPSNTLK